MSKNIAVFLDGTCDSYADGAKNNSNVGRMYDVAASDGVRQVTFYSDGVGCDFDLAGAVTGEGCDQRIARGYNFVLGTYEPGDDVYLFGFSRGAFEARSLAGMLSFAGLLKKDSGKSINDAFAAYRDGDATFKAQYSIDIPLKFVGVWDTVEALGLPIAGTLLTVGAPSFHRLGLTPQTAKACHALAIDEQRGDFTPTHFDPDPRAEEVWFAGVHSDVGGGYTDDCKLSNVTLAWMMQRAKASGLLFRDETLLQCADADALGTLHNSYDGIYNLRTVYHRTIDPGMALHDAVRRRLAGGSYAPINLDRTKSYNYIT